MIEDVGRDVAIAYGVFLVIAMFVSLISTGVFIAYTLADLLDGDMTRVVRSGVSGQGTLLVLLATATIAVPYFWKHKIAPLAFAVPLLFTIMAFWPLYKQHRAQQQAIAAMGEFGPMMGQVSGQMGGSIGGPFDSLGIGAWLLFATVIFLAFRGVMRFLARG